MSHDPKNSPPAKGEYPEGGRGLVPKLRFPEFLEAGEWMEKTLEQVATYENGKAHENNISDKGRYIVVNSKFISTEGEVRKCSDDAFCIADAGDVLMVLSDVPNGRAIAKCYLVEADNLYTVNQRICKIKPTEINGRFLFYIFDRNPFFLAFDDGVKQTNLRKEDVLNCPLCIPHLQEEQQKIASCLASLDELITLEAQKLDTLKRHKKGLMQQLFPAEGETLPRLRFPEFRDAGEWEERELGLLTTKVGSGITPTGGDKNYKLEGRPFVRSQNVGWGELILDDVAFIDEETHQSFDSTEIKVSDVLLNITGASIGRSAVADSRIAGGNVNQHVCIIRVKQSTLNPALLNHFLISERGQKQIDSFQAGGNRQGLNFAQIRSFKIPLPPTESEQRQIASCLASLDDLITAQTQQLAALKTQKKGLMQQLFPLTPTESTP